MLCQLLSSNSPESQCGHKKTINESGTGAKHRTPVADSVEEKVLELQTKKRKLLEDVFEASEAANAKVTLQDLKELI